MLTYWDVIEELKKSALEEPNINFAGSKDIYNLNSIPDIDYDVFYITPNQHTWNEDTVRYSLNLYYISRWDESDNNQLIIHSRGMIKLQNIVNRFSDRYPELQISYPGRFTLFYQKFKDMTAGVYLTIEFILPSVLACDYEEYEK